ncbi:putative RNA methyltransferase [Luteitalea sp. TBR-22]|uniref:class I SAM-dependent RNA methyltransferase n=1 Tax=Luteitalea sp. TBR-22 TaxID=2802971 RepID=UPI001AF60E54|nr:RsmD family RNA methyltransferase [Luteitalea sp. TBR-22]BCS34177.1 putative RNA methyltransferase [Luteitalea sp. TBR-22]
MAEDHVHEVLLEKPVAGGRSLARVDGRVVLVSGGIPGERATILVEKTGKGVAFGRVVDVLDPSPDRVTPSGDPRCGGLVFAHVAAPRQLDIKRAIVQDALERIGGLRDLPPIDAVASPATGWRLRARLHVQGRRVGFFLEGTHTLCDAGASGQLAPGLLDLAAEVVARLRPEVVPSVEAVLVTQAVSGDGRAVHLELSRPLPRHGEVWSDGAPPDCAGVSAALASSRHPSTIEGDPRVRDAWTSLGLQVDDAVAGIARHAAAFFQGNRVLLPALLARVLGAAADAPRVVDLYAGVGLFGLAAAARGAGAVTCVEGDPISAEDLVANATAFGSRVRAVRGDVEGFVAGEGSRLADACVIVDPPRTGLSPVALGAVAAARPSTVAYVSCDPATLARDLKVLVAQGLAVETVTVFDMFPVTAHVEALVVLRRT